MTSDAAHDADLTDVDPPIWEEDYLPPPWSAVIDDETGLWQVVCDGYNDERPVVCAGTESWPLSEADARILSASLDLLDAARPLIAEIAEYEPSSGEDDDELVSVKLGELKRLRRAVQKADLRGGGV